MKGASVGVVFDIDGTLVDSNYQHAIAWWRAFREHGYRVPIHQVHRCIGMGGDQLMQTLIGEYSEEAQQARAEHFKGFHPELQAFEGAAELLKRVSEAAQVVIATSATKADLDVLMAAIGAADAIDHVTSADEVEHGKPAPDVFRKALDVSGLAPDRALVLGDTRWDIEAASRVGMSCLCVESGGWGRCELAESGAAAVYRDTGDLLEHLDESLIAELVLR